MVFNEGMIDPGAIRKRYDSMALHLDERGLRLFAASEARAAGHGGIAAVAAVTGVARSTIGRGLTELARNENAPPQERVRRTGGGRYDEQMPLPGGTVILRPDAGRPRGRAGRKGQDGSKT